MSRHELCPRPEVKQKLSVVVGWDPPLNTFFAQVIDDALEDEGLNPVLLWEGTLYGEISDVDSVIAAVARFAEVPAEVRTQLKADRLREGSRPKLPWVLAAPG